MYLKALLMVVAILRFSGTSSLWLGKHGIIKQIIDTEIDWTVWGLTSLIGVGENTLGGQTIVYIVSLFVNIIISGLIELVLQKSYILICNTYWYICRHIKNKIGEYNQKMKQLRNTQTIYNTIEGVMILLTVLIGGSIGRNIAISIF